MFKPIGPSLLMLLLSMSFCRAQSTMRYDLDGLLSNHKLFVNPRSTATPVVDGKYKGVSCSGVVWITGADFSTGTIDVDLRGKDVFQQSFLGIAFHGEDSITYDAVYFRPFNFRSTDTLRRKHMVQYMSEPEYPWDRLRKEHPLVYESGIVSAPPATVWFHAHIVVTKDKIWVYVNHAYIPSLVVKKLNNRNSGLLGLWDDSLPGDFANLVVTNQSIK